MISARLHNNWKSGKAALLTVLLLTASLGYTSCKMAGEDAAGEAISSTDVLSIPPLLDRKGALAQTPEWQKTKEKVGEINAKISNQPANEQYRLQLAMIYMQEARVTGNPYYYQATWKILDGVHQLKPDNFEAFVFKASVAMSLHNFAEAKTLAEKALTINPYNAYVYGVLVDANVELGNYAEAVKMSDKMQELKPSLESYSRASYLREIYGDNEGAIEAMQMAVKAGATGLESTEWARVTLGDLYLNTGKLKEAEDAYASALVARPQFPNAEIGMAKLERARKNYDAAIAHTEAAIRILSEVSYVSLLGDLHEEKGDKKKAAEIRADVVKLIVDGEKDQSDKILIKHNGNRELAQAYMNEGNLAKALKYAANDYKLRSANIDANELLATIYYRHGDYAKAKAHADKMLATGTKNAATLYKASLIYSRAGDAVKAQSYAAESRKLNPYLNGNAILLAAK